jgi:homospermidine synthase
MSPDPFLRYNSVLLSRHNYGQILSRYVSRGSVVVNLAVSVDCLDIADWCQSNGALYLDTAFEPWDDDIFELEREPAQRTVYSYHEQARMLARDRWLPGGPTAVFGHGANPGLVSHFVKAAILSAAVALEFHGEAPSSRVEWAELAHDLDIRVIHFSERDSQTSLLPRLPGEFYNTWSAIGFIEEASRPAEFGWGTHERELPCSAKRHHDSSDHAIYIPRPSHSVGIRSWVPRGGPISGLALPHSECITTSAYLSLLRDGQLIYRPTVAYSYLPCDAALASIHEVHMRDWSLPERITIMNEDITSGGDELGVLLMGPNIGALWYGSYLDLQSVRRILPGHNPTAVQVAAGAFAALKWMMKNPREGYCEPEQLPFREILDTADPYLGDVGTFRSDWTPLARKNVLYPESQNTTPNDLWQFKNFVAFGL